VNPTTILSPTGLRLSSLTPLQLRELIAMITARRFGKIEQAILAPH
jgi:hypothetical protein